MARHHAWDVIAAAGLGAAIEACIDRWPEAAILDAAGIERDELQPLLTWLRRRARIPVVFVSAADDVEGRIQALHVGVDDHAVAPIDVHELEERVLAQLRRASRLNMRIVGDVVVDRKARLLVRRGVTVALTPNELSLFDRLLSAAGQIVTKRELQEAIGHGDQSENAIEVHISALRRKLGQGGPPIIHTVHAQGYVLRPQPASDLAQRAEAVTRREAQVQRREDAVGLREDAVVEREDAMVERDRLLSLLEPDEDRVEGDPPEGSSGRVISS